MIDPSEGIEIWIPGKPIAKARPRFTTVDGKKRAYNNQTSQEDAWVLQAREQIHDKTVRNGVLFVDITFWMPEPKRFTRYSELFYHTNTPDLDNLIKFAMDCLNHVGIWKDDKQVARIEAIKAYNPIPATEIIIRWDVENWNWGRYV